MVCILKWEKLLNPSLYPSSTSSYFNVCASIVSVPQNSSLTDRTDCILPLGITWFRKTRGLDQNQYVFYFFTSVTNICTLPKELVLHFVRDLILLLNTSLKELTIDLIFHTGHEQLFPEWKEKVLCSFNPTVHPWPLPYAHFPLFIFLDPTLSFCSCSNYKRSPPDRKRKYGSYWPAFIYPQHGRFFLMTIGSDQLHLTNQPTSTWHNHMSIDPL